MAPCGLVGAPARAKLRASNGVLWRSELTRPGFRGMHRQTGKALSWWEDGEYVGLCSGGPQMAELGGELMLWGALDGPVGCWAVGLWGHVRAASVWSCCSVHVTVAKKILCLLSSLRRPVPLEESRQTPWALVSATQAEVR